MVPIHPVTGIEPVDCETHVWMGPQKCKFCVKPVGGQRSRLLINHQ